MCPDQEILSAYFDGEVPAPWNRHIEKHIASCSVCAEKIRVYTTLQTHLLDDTDLDVVSPMERIKTKLAAVQSVSGTGSRFRKSRIWDRKISLPIPLIAAAAVFVIGIGLIAVFNTTKTDPSKINIVTQKGDGSMTEVNITGKDADEIEALLRALEQNNMPNEAIIRLPDGSNRFQAGEPELLREVDFNRNDQ